MKKFELLILISFNLISCTKDPFLFEPTIDLSIGYLSGLGGVHMVYYENQDTIFWSELDTAIVIRVTEKDLEICGLDYLILENLEFTIYVNTLYDNERYESGKNVYSIGRGLGKNNIGQLSFIDNGFVIPIRLTALRVNNNKTELSQTNEFIRISYESKYTGLSKVKTITIAN